MLVKNEYYKDLAVIPELLQHEKYDEAINICKTTLKNISDCSLSWHLLGLLYLYKINNVDTICNDYNKQIEQAFIKSIEILPCVDPYINARDICTEYLRKRQCHKPGNIIDVNNILFNEYDNYKNKLLSRIYLSISQMQYNIKNIDINIEEAHTALKLDNQCPGAYFLLYGMYKEIKKDVPKSMDLLTKCLSLKNVNYVQSIIPCVALAEQYSKQNKLKEAAYYRMTGLRRIISHNRINGANNYNIKGEYLSNGKIKTKYIKPDDVPYYLLDEKINGEQAHYWAALAYWKEGDYVRSKKHLRYAVESKYPENDTAFTEKLKNMYDSPVGLLMRIQDVDYHINNIMNMNIDSLDDLYKASYYLEKTIKRRVNKDYYKSITKYINISPVYNNLSVVIPKRIYSAVLFAALQKYHCHLWPLHEYLAEVIMGIIDDTKQDTLYGDLFNSILMKLDLDEYITGYIRKTTSEAMLSSSEEDRIGIEYKEICELMRLIFSKYGFTQSIKSVDKLEEFIRYLSLNKNNNATNMIKELIEAFNEIGGKLTTCNENMTVLTNSDLFGMNNIKGNEGEKLLTKFRETVVNRYVVYTHDSINPQKYENKYEKDKDKYNIFIDERYPIVRIKHRNRKMNFTPKNVLVDLLIRKYKIATYSELLKYSKVDKHISEGKSIVAGWINEINKIAKWKKDTVIINEPSIKGYRINKGITYCIIYNPNIERIPKKVVKEEDI